MYRNLTNSVLSLVVLSGGLMSATSSEAKETLTFRSGHTTIVNNYVSASQEVGGSRSVTRRVQNTPSYGMKRSEVYSGTRITLFANFLEEKPGKVQLCMKKTALPCEVVQWSDEAVIVNLPKVGLENPVDATIRIIKPNGREAKKYYVLFGPQPEILIHKETVGQPDPSAPTSKSASYAGGEALSGPVVSD